jgi:hypothetical protein
MLGINIVGQMDNVVLATLQTMLYGKDVGIFMRGDLIMILLPPWKYGDKLRRNYRRIDSVSDNYGRSISEYGIRAYSFTNNQSGSISNCREEPAYDYESFYGEHLEELQ